MTVEDVLKRLDSLRTAEDQLRMGHSVDRNVIADHLSDYAQLLRKLSVNI
jgi:hypothetical protein